MALSFESLERRRCSGRLREAPEKQRLRIQRRRWWWEGCRGDGGGGGGGSGCVSSAARFVGWVFVVGVVVVVGATKQIPVAVCRHKGLYSEIFEVQQFLGRGEEADAARGGVSAIGFIPKGYQPPSVYQLGIVGWQRKC